MVLEASPTRFAAALRMRRRPKALSGVFLGLITTVLLALAGIFLARMIGQLSEGRLQSVASADLWRDAGPALACLLTLGVLFVRQISLYWLGRGQDAQSDLRQRLVWAFSLVGILPTIIMLTLTVAYFSLGFSGWIDRTLSRVLEEQNALTDGYSRDLQNKVGEDLAQLGLRLSGFLEEGVRAQALERFLQQIADLGGYWHLYLYDATGTPRLRTGPGKRFDPILPGSVFRETAESLNGRMNLTLTEDFRLVRALALVPNTVPLLYVYGSQLVDPAFTEGVQSARRARAELVDLEARLRWVFFVVSAILVLVALVLLLATLTVALWFANRLLEPIGNIIAAAQDMGEGSLDVRVPVSDRQFSEFRMLSNSFNTMAGRLEQQQSDLRDANSQIAARQQFTSAVLTGVSAGVLGLGADFSLTLPNRAAGELLGVALEPRIGEDIRIFLPEFTPLLNLAAKDQGSVRSIEIKMFHKQSGNLLILLASALAERLEGQIVGYVVTFDDISELASVQRQTVWSEMARRIAHEIKNPLTPIQLSTERLKRRFAHMVEGEGSEVFNLCLDTILRQVETISRLVGEFSSFSRMPTASLAPMDLAQLARQAHFLQASGFEGQDWEIDVPETSVMINGDQTLLNQALQNLLKNAGEAARDTRGGQRPKVRIHLQVDEAGKVILLVLDNGPGFPEDLLSRLGEPYVSTKQSGTGLGLAIVKKVVEDHAGSFSAANVEQGGARLTLTFPPLKIQGDEEDRKDEEDHEDQRAA